ncbi:hypothetical protein HDU76_003604 [Blyttiomyces sp. JEL0837]|nr:hypothetical protein HDU76_003604 [Blyttiomyces sp. JEL0837]
MEATDEVVDRETGPPASAQTPMARPTVRTGCYNEIGLSSPQYLPLESYFGHHEVVKQPGITETITATNIDLGTAPGGFSKHINASSSA